MTERSADADIVQITDASDVVIAGRRLKAKLSDGTVEDSTIEEVVLVVHELASNIVNHATSGRLVLTSVSNEDRNGIEIRAEDSGPGIPDVEHAVEDGYSTVGGLGGGLGTVHRLMDEVIIDSDGELGTQIDAVRWFDCSTSTLSNPPLSIGAATRAKPGHEVNGDAFVIEHGHSRTLVGVIDGLGHGKAANKAAEQARQYIRSHSERSLSQLFDGSERVCQSSRGVVMALARFDREAGTVTVSGVGNITVKIFTGSESRSLVSTRGVVGARNASPTTTELDWESDDALVIHSDGLTSQWGWEQFNRLHEVPVTRATRELLHSLSQGTDDATVLMARGAER